MIAAALYDNRNALTVPFAIDDDRQQHGIADEYDDDDDDGAIHCGKSWWENHPTRRFDHDAMPCLFKNFHKMMALRRPWWMLHDPRAGRYEHHLHRRRRLPLSSSEANVLPTIPSYDSLESSRRDANKFHIAPIHPPTATTVAATVAAADSSPTFPFVHFPTKTIARHDSSSSSSSSSSCDHHHHATPSLFRWRRFTHNDNNNDKTPDHRSMLEGSPMYVQYVDFGEHYDESDEYYYDEYDDEAEDSFPLYDDDSSEPDLAAVDVSCESCSNTSITESSSLISSSSSSSPPPLPALRGGEKNPRLSFAEVCVVLEIPHYRLYTPAEREAMWMNTAMIERMAQRNLIEYQYEGGDGASVLEEHDFIVVPSGIAIHPAHMARVVDHSDAAVTTTMTARSNTPTTPSLEPKIVLQHLLQELLWGL